MKFQALLFSLFCAVVLWNAAPARADESTTEKVARAMGGYHFQAKPDALEKIAGGQDELIAALTELRTNSKVPFVAIRAERLLLVYADRPDVEALLLQDLNSEVHKGLARTIATHIDRAPETARRSLGRAAFARGQRDADFRTYARSLEQSADPEIRKIARGLPE